MAEEIEKTRACARGANFFLVTALNNVKKSYLSYSESNFKPKSMKDKKKEKLTFEASISVKKR